MKIAQKFLSASLSLLMAANVSGCSSLTKQQKSTAIGAGVGGIAGSAVTGGSTLGTVGGAVVGGVLGSEVGKTK
jgi:osmotically inducible lipoprotein OsmB